MCLSKPVQAINNSNKTLVYKEICPFIKHYKYRPQEHYRVLGNLLGTLFVL
jgi:hypothetical protein